MNENGLNGQFRQNRSADCRDLILGICSTEDGPTTTMFHT
jgi:hypothetical protein